MQRKPIVGPAFDAEQTNDAGRVSAYLSELRYYRPRGFSKLMREGEKIERMFERDDENAGEWADEWKTDVESLLTDWARKIERHDYICFGSFGHNGCVGFYILTDNAIEDAGAKVDDLGDLPKGFTGLAIQVSDHGNVSAYNYSNGRMTRELFAVV